MFLTLISEIWPLSSVLWLLGHWRFMLGCHGLELSTWRFWCRFWRYNFLPEYPVPMCMSWDLETKGQWVTKNSFEKWSDGSSRANWLRWLFRFGKASSIISFPSWGNKKHYIRTKRRDLFHSVLKKRLLLMFLYCIKHQYLCSNSKTENE